MIDALLQSQAILNTLTVITRLILLGCSLLLLGGLGYFLLDHRRRTLRFAALLVAILGLSLTVLACLPFLWRFADPMRPPFAVSADLSAGPSFEPFKEQCRDSPRRYSTRRDCIYEGAGKVILKFSGERRLEQQSRMVWVAGEPEELETIKIFSDALSTVDAFSEAAELFSRWNTPTEDLRSWLRRADTGSKEEFFQHHDSVARQGVIPTLHLMIKRIENTEYDAAPWFLLSELRWPEKPKAADASESAEINPAPQQTPDSR